ncbi:MAG: Asp-tRNA(Asn)/Glu-tRNA(Gln) amidotransferase subunit GatA [Candidatus Omnitrophica bacterium]|nr:Asp-tRNA(Asn)/Glu-tRNA(Gln) amidotransferase subunit GatA [Candidatus Omnitrophota bacterium]
MELFELTAHELIKMMKGKEISPEDIAHSLIKRVKEQDGTLGAYMLFDEEEILNRCKKLTTHGDSPLQGQAPIPKLWGIPVAIKDNICVDGELTRCSSKILEGFRPPYNATVINKLSENGAILLGKTNMDEFAFGSSTETSAFKITRNPWDKSRIPGGSSGGSACAVASGEAVGALGSDTGGSIRQPASLCGVVGLKPTYGRVSRYGLIAFASSLDQIGPLTKDVEDCAIFLGAIAGHDERDSTSADVEVPDYTKLLKKDAKGLTIGVPKEYFVEGLDKEVAQRLHDAAETFKKLGANIKEISLPHTEYAVAVYYILAPSEASSNLARFDGVQYGLRKEGGDIFEMYKRTRSAGFGREAKRRIILGTYSLSSGYYEAYYLKALKVRALIKKDFDDAFKSCDAILTPTSPTPAFKIGEKMDDPLSMYLSDIFTISVNLAGLPAVSIPCGFTSGNLPIGMQIIGKPFDEGTILRTAYAFEQNTDFHKRRPELG